MTKFTLKILQILLLKGRSVLGAEQTVPGRDKIRVSVKRKQRQYSDFVGIVWKLTAFQAEKDLGGHIA